MSRRLGTISILVSLPPAARRVMLIHLELRWLKTLKRRSEVENPKYMKSLLAMLAYCFYLIIPIFGKATLFTEKVIARRVILDTT